MNFVLLNHIFILLTIHARFHLDLVECL
ncbi:unnamed protein product [Macrosiphum euphorbiae]|uniref:Uncharacterized protein n=1 Tax=Macrosiphum euphorbiae TaxID=13131 RepID=A0AAV0WN64_9HEMI|nr:unnamed protein product [Macrosiphum euphorbiae]